MFKIILNTIRLALAHYTEQEHQILSIKCCIPEQPKFDSPLLKRREHRMDLFYRVMKGFPFAKYEINRKTMQKLIKSLVNNKFIQNVS